MTIDINSLNGISKDIALLLTSDKKTLNSKEESIFIAIDNAAKDLINTGSLNFTKIFQSLYKICKPAVDFFKDNITKIIKFCKNLAEIIIKKCKDLVNHSGTRDDIVSAAEGFVGNVNNRKIGNILFSNGRDEEWCANTATFILKDIVGSKLPVDFGSSSVSGLKDWGIRHKCYKETSGMKSADRAKYIFEHVKPGDLMIEKRGKSHVRIITKVYPDGSFDVIEGNAGSNDPRARKVVKKEHISPDISTLSGFVHLEQWLG